MSPASETPLVEQRDAERRRMLDAAERAVRGGHKNVIVDAAALIGLFADLDTHQQREAEAARPRVRLVPCIFCGLQSPAGGTCPRCDLEEFATGAREAALDAQPPIGGLRS